MQPQKEARRGLFSYAGKYKALSVCACILSGISAVLILMPFICIWQVVREIFAVLPNVGQAQNLSYYGWLAVAFALAGIIVYFAALMCSHLAAFRTARNMRSEALHHIVRLPLGYFNQNSSGRLRRIIDESAGQTEAFLAHMLPDLAGAIVTPFAMLVILLIFDWRLGLVSLVPMIIGFIILSRMMGTSMNTSMQQYQNALEDMNSEAVEYVRGIPVVKTFQQSVYSFKNFHAAIKRYSSWAVDYTLKCRLPMCGFTVSVNGVFAFLIPAGILLIASAVDYKTFLLNFIFYVLFTPVVTVMMTRIMFSGENALMARDAARRIETILLEKPLEEPAVPVRPEGASIVFDQVRFTYSGSDTPAIDGVSFEIPEGATVALVGPSGGGKTTAASLIPRFWDVQEGRVCVGGVDVRQIATTDLMDQVSFVFQNTRLQKASLLENIRSARPDAPAEAVLAAARAARCEDIFEKLPQGIDTVVGTKGVYLSGGEAQRIALARAILKDAPIVLLDEATAFADPENEYQIQKAFEELTKGKTVLMIAHRLTTVRHADCILVMENGRVTEQGTHEALLEKGGTYAAMWKEYQSTEAWKITGKEAA